MRLLLLVLTTALLTCAAAAPAAPAKTKRYPVRVGVGDQQVAMFGQPAFRKLHVRKVRYFIAWNAMRHRAERLAARRYVKTARRAHARVFLHVSTDDYRIKKAHLPSVKRYRREIRRMVRYFRKLGVRDFGAWNEANHASQPTWDHPRRAARFFKVMRREVFRRCSRACRVVGLDVLDQRGVSRYIRRFVRGLGRRYARRYLRVVGIHNYSDVNRHRTRGLRTIMRATRRYAPRAKFWLTETGGIVKFGRSFPCSERRAARRLGYLFNTMRRYRHRLQRVYLYNWTGGDCAVRFDAGLTRADGTPRRGYRMARRKMKHFRR